MTSIRELEPVTKTFVKLFCVCIMLIEEFFNWYVEKTTNTENPQRLSYSTVKLRDVFLLAGFFPLFSVLLWDLNHCMSKCQISRLSTRRQGTPCSYIWLAVLEYLCLGRKEKCTQFCICIFRFEHVTCENWQKMKCVCEKFLVCSVKFINLSVSYWWCNILLVFVNSSFSQYKKTWSY